MRPKPKQSQKLFVFAVCEIVQGIDWTAMQEPKETPCLHYFGPDTSVVFRNFAVNEGSLDMLLKPNGEVLSLDNGNL